MKKLTYALACSSLFVGASLFAQIAEADAVRFRIDNQKGGEGDPGVDFLSAAMWSQYDTGLSGPEQWASVTDLTKTPWEKDQAASNRMQLKMDNSIANVNSAFGASDNYINVNVTGLYNSTLNINADFYIMENIWQDGNSEVNINGTATVSLGGDGNGRINVDRVNLNGTSATERVNYYGNFNLNEGDTRTYTAKNANIYHSDWLRIGTNNEGKDTDRSLTIGDNVTLETSNIRIGANDDSNSGKASLLVTGNDSVITVSENIAWDGTRRSGGEAVFAVSGARNTITTGGFNFSGDDAAAPAEGNTNIAKFDLGGEDNTLTVSGDINFNGDRRAGGESTFAVTGTNNTVTASNVNFNGNDATSGSKAVASFTVEGADNEINISGGINFNGDRRAGGDSIFEVAGDGNKVTANGIRMGGAEATGGTAKFVVSGDNAVITVTNGIEWTDYGKSDGDAIVAMTGNHSTITVTAGNVNIDGWSGGSTNMFTGGNSGIEISGVGNRFESSNRIAMGLAGDGGGTFSGGKTYMHVKSESDAAGDEAVIKVNEITLGLGNVAGTTYESELIFGGNTRLEKYNTEGNMTIHVGANNGSTTIVGGTSTMIVENSNNILDLNYLTVGSQGNRDGGDSIVEVKGSDNVLNILNEFTISTTSGETVSRGGTGTVIVAGTGNSIIANVTSIGNADNSYSANGALILGGTNTTFETYELKIGSGAPNASAVDPTISGRFVIKGSGVNAKVTGSIRAWSTTSDFDLAYDSGKFSIGAWLVFEFDGSGISTLDISAASQDLGGLFILLDFSNIVTEMNAEYMLVSGLSSFDFDKIRGLLSDGTLAEAGQVGTNGEYFDIVDKGDGNYWVYYYNAIPEPATYAAIFGALVLAFAAYRRKK